MIATVVQTAPIKRLFTFDMPMSDPVRAFIERAISMGLPLCPMLVALNWKTLKSALSHMPAAAALSGET